MCLQREYRLMVVTTTCLQRQYTLRVNVTPLTPLWIRLRSIIVLKLLPDPLRNVNISNVFNNMGLPAS